MNLKYRFVQLYEMLHTILCDMIMLPVTQHVIYIRCYNVLHYITC